MVSESLIFVIVTDVSVYKLENEIKNSARFQIH